MPAYRGPVVDVDIHHRPKFPQQEWAAYLSDEWKRTVDGTTLPFYNIPITTGGAGTSIPHAGRRKDLGGDPGVVAGYDLAELQRAYLDPGNVWRGILTYDTGDFEAGQNPYFTSDVCRAVNDWNLDTWLGADERLYGLIAVPTSWPEAGAAEIRRLGGHERFAGVLLSNNGLGIPFGHPVVPPDLRGRRRGGPSHPRPLHHRRPCGGDRGRPLRQHRRAHLAAWGAGDAHHLQLHRARRI